jgi:hypothetical protein
MKTTRRQHLLDAAIVGAMVLATTGVQGEEINTRIGKLSFENGQVQVLTSAMKVKLSGSEFFHLS